MEMIAPSFKVEEFNDFLTVLRNDHYGRMQFRDGYKEDVKRFCIVRAKGKALEGHISGLNESHARFSAFFHPGQDNPLIRIAPENPNGRYKHNTAYGDIVNALTVMMDRAANGKATKINTKYWKGLYLINTGDRGIGKKSLENFEFAESLGLISPDFSQSCVEYGFRMSLYGVA